MQVSELFNEFDILQKQHGEKSLDAIYGCGNIVRPKMFLVFMNPTARNVSSDKQWTGLKAPWLGTKNIWKMLHNLGFIHQDLMNRISARKPFDWDYDFAEEVYRAVCKNSLYITNLSKATQIDARPLSTAIFKQYVDLLKKEISIIQPRVIIVFGNQVSSALLGKNIKVSDYRKKHELLEIEGKKFKIFPIYYPVGQGMRNISVTQEDIQ